MVNTRRTRRQTHSPYNCNAISRTIIEAHKMAGPSTVFHLQRLPASKFNDAELTIIRSYCEETYRLLLETLNAHQVATKRPINPDGDIKNLEKSGTSVYILQLVMEVEKPLAWPSESTLSESTLMLQQRVERIQVYYGLKECPQNERPKPKTSTALIEPQSYNQPSTNYTNPGLDELPIDALFFTWRAFGHLFHRLPPMGGEEPSQSSLISLYLEVKYAWEFGSLLHTYASIPFKRPDQASTLRHKPCPP